MEIRKIKFRGPVVSTFWKWSFISASLVIGCLSVSAKQSKPNIVLIYADDVGYGDIGCYGATGVDTPNLDNLAQNGRRFTSAYATASTCTPSRYSVLTGEYAFRNKDAQILPGNAPLIIDPKKPTMASVLKSAGYATALVGKWHLGLGKATEALDWNGRIAPGPKELGFEYSYHMAATGDRVPSVYIENGYIVDLDKSDPVAVNYEGQIGSEPTGVSHPWLLKVQADLQHSGTIVNGVSRIGWMTGGQAARWVDEDMGDQFLKKALTFIEQEKDNPFFLFFATHENHVPRIPHPRFVGSSSMGARGDVVAQMDWNIGKIMEKLEELGLTENTIVMFSSDNGPVLFDGYRDGAIESAPNHDASGPWRGGKYSAWEGGTRLPLVVSWPGTIDAGRSDALISQVDLLASCAAIAGGKIKKGYAEDSVDLSDLLLGKSESGRDALIQQGVGMKSIRKGDWKYLPAGVTRDRGKVGEFIMHDIPATGALFYLPEDPEELNNVASVYPEKAKELHELLVASVGEEMTTWADELGGADTQSAK